MIFKHSRGTVEFTQKTVNGRFDATTNTTIKITRNDGRVFKVSECFGIWACKTERFSEYDQVVAFFRKHGLPSIMWIEQEVQQRLRHFYDDPMTEYYGLSASDVGLI